MSDPKLGIISIEGWFKLVLIFALALVASYLLFTSNILAQETTTPAAPVDEVTDLTFPIEELGGCDSYKSCMTYCDDPVNNAICVDYAKQKGFYLEDPVLAPTDDFLEEAEDALGCNSLETCEEFCSQETNYATCDEFAKSQEIPGGGYVEEPDKPEFLEKAKELLGCDSASSCSNFCSDAANATKCDEFADSVGLLGGQTPVGPGGCTSPESCDNFCRDPGNFNKCAAFAPPGGNFTGPGGCNSPETCRTQCETNPSSCRSYAPGSNGVYVPAVCPADNYFGPGGVCTPVAKTQEASSCAQEGSFWDGDSCETTPPPGIAPKVGGAFFQTRPEMGGCKTPGECYDFCAENADKCPGFKAGTGRPTDDYIPSLYFTPGTEVKFTPKSEMGNCDSPGACYDYCKENPGKCQGFDNNSPRPVSVYTPGTYYTPPETYTYFTPPATSFYVTPMYYTPPAGSNYTTPTYYTPGIYSTPTYYTPFVGSNYTTPTYYTPGSYYSTPVGSYTTPSYTTPIYYTPPSGSNYNTPSYYTPPTYTSPTYYTPPLGSTYSSPSYGTPATYSTPSYYTPFTGGNYSTPIYYTPPPGSNYTTPNYQTPSYYTPSGTTYGTPSTTAGYSYPSPGSSSNYTTPAYVYPSPSGQGVSYYTPNSSYTYPSPTDGYVTPSYASPYVSPTSGSGGYSYPTPSSYSYPTPSTYGTPSYATPSYNTPSYGTPEYSTPPPYSSPPVVQGVATKSVLQTIVDILQFK